MRKIILLTGLATILFASCEREHEPFADFSASRTLVVPGEIVFFTNQSQYIERCEWDFGDGYTSNELNPNHYYSDEGIYQVRLAAYNNGHVDYAYMDIEVYLAEPNALFTASYTLVTPNEVVFFDNLSSNANKFEWDFGDGYVSSEENPTHSFSKEGIYNVRLAAYNHDLVDYYYFEIEVYETTLEVEVREYFSGDLISDVEITLFETYTDWYDLTNPLISGFTDANGLVIFKNLNAIRYYIDAYSTYYDNNQLGQEDIGFIETHPLAYATHNVFVAYVDYYPEGKANSDNLKGTNRVRTPVIKEIKRIHKEKALAVK